MSRNDAEILLSVDDVMNTDFLNPSVPQLLQSALKNEVVSVLNTTVVLSEAPVDEITVLNPDPSLRQPIQCQLQTKEVSDLNTTVVLSEAPVEELTVLTPSDPALPQVQNKEVVALNTTVVLSEAPVDEITVLTPSDLAFPQLQNKEISALNTTVVLSEAPVDEIPVSNVNPSGFQLKREEVSALNTTVVLSESPVDEVTSELDEDFAECNSENTVKEHDDASYAGRFFSCSNSFDSEGLEPAGNDNVLPKTPLPDHKDVKTSLPANKRISVLQGAHSFSPSVLLSPFAKLHIGSSGTDEIMECDSLEQISPLEFDEVVTKAPSEKTIADLVLQKLEDFIAETAEPTKSAASNLPEARESVGETDIETTEETPIVEDNSVVSVKSVPEVGILTLEEQKDEVAPTGDQSVDDLVKNEDLDASAPPLEAPMKNKDLEIVVSHDQTVVLSSVEGSSVADIPLRGEDIDMSEIDNNSSGDSTIKNEDFSGSPQATVSPTIKAEYEEEVFITASDPSVPKPGNEIDLVADFPLKSLEVEPENEVEALPIVEAPVSVCSAEVLMESPRSDTSMENQEDDAVFLEPTRISVTSIENLIPADTGFHDSPENDGRSIEEISANVEETECENMDETRVIDVALSSGKEPTPKEDKTAVETVQNSDGGVFKFVRRIGSMVFSSMTTSTDQVRDHAENEEVCQNVITTKMETSASLEEGTTVEKAESEIVENRSFKVTLPEQNVTVIETETFIEHNEKTGNDSLPEEKSTEVLEMAENRSFKAAEKSSISESNCKNTPPADVPQRRRSSGVTIYPMDCFTSTPIQVHEVEEQLSSDLNHHGYDQYLKIKLEINHLKQTIAQCCIDIKKKERQIMELLPEKIQSMPNKPQVLDEKQTIREHQCHQLEIEVEKLRQELAYKNQAQAKLQQSLLDVDTVLEQYSQQLKTLNDQLNSEKKASAQLTETLAQILERNNSYMKTNQTLQSNEVIYKETIENLKNEYNKLREKYKEQVALANKENHRLETIVRGVQPKGPSQKN